MKDTDYQKICEFVYRGGGFLPLNENARELASNCKMNEVVQVMEVTKRDLRFHQCYFSMLNYIWGLMPQLFQETVPQHNFYKWLKHLKGEYDVVFEFKDGTKMVEYQSISFGRMSQKTFEEYIKLQLPWIYENVIGKVYNDDDYGNIVQMIEDEYEKFLSKL